MRCKVCGEEIEPNPFFGWDLLTTEEAFYWHVVETPFNKHIAIPEKDEYVQ